MNFRKLYLTFDRILFLALFFLAPALICAQEGKAIAKEEKRTLKTYPFSDPTRTPILTDNPKIYPYFTFEGYSHEGRSQDWKVVKLENDYVEVYVLPEVGGKVWGAIEKSTGNEFIYRNEVMKFRNIAMRGPWTSGGIEFNFGLIGHTPATATPVDYLIRENSDGSVSCIVGNIDLPSRTQWRVEVRLPKDGAYFDTRALWYNPTPLHQSYYNWMTGAAAAREDLEFYCPGDQYLGHPGEAHPWPDEYGRKISEYSQNNFGGSKSYHVVGEYNDFFGGYFHNSGYGFGHWSRYDEMPGQKLWLWALSRSGGIWEDLLTDTDGQYIEFQAGRLFNQYSPSDSYRNPITQAVFPPYTADKWEERWFPVKEIGGISDVSPTAAMHVREDGGRLNIAVNALAAASGTLKVVAGAKTLHQEAFSLKPMEVFSLQVGGLNGEKDYEVIVPEMDLHYYANPDRRRIDRPFETPAVTPVSEAQRHFNQGIELLEFRDYPAAQRHFEQCLELDANHIGALGGLAELSFRSGHYEKGISFARRALQFDTYDPAANFRAGINYRAKGDFVNALETLGWAARSMEYRSAAYAQMAEVHLQMDDLTNAAHYAGRALDFNRFNTNALEVLTIVNRKEGKPETAKQLIARLQEIDPLHHLARFEQYLLESNDANRQALTGPIKSELAYQAYLEMAISYYNRGQIKEAAAVLEFSPAHPLVEIWRAYLLEDGSGLDGIIGQSPDFVFPYRSETLDALAWAAEKRPHWKLQYYLALNLWGKNRLEEAAFLMGKAGNTPDYAPFYIARAELMDQHLGRDQESDLKRALELDPEEWRTYHRLVEYYLSANKSEDALKTAKFAREKFAGNYTMDMDYVRTLLDKEQYSSAMEVLKNLKVLPFEGASEGRNLYERAHLGLALEQIRAGAFEDAVSTLEASKEWPERLGVGKPYDAEERRQDYLLAHCFEQLGQPEKVEEYRQKVIRYTLEHAEEARMDHILGLKLMSDMEANILIENWKPAFEDEPSAVLAWVIATYKEDPNLLAQLEMSPQHQNRFTGPDFDLLEETLRY